MVGVMARRDTPDQPVIHRDAQGDQQAARDRETLTERLIRVAQRDGHFDDLPGQGRPLALEDDGYAGDMALANHVPRNAGAAPPWIEADKQARELLTKVEALLDHARTSPPTAAKRLSAELEALTHAHDRTVMQLASLAPSERQHRPRLDGAELRLRLARALAKDATST